MRSELINRNFIFPSLVTFTKNQKIECFGFSYMDMNIFTYEESARDIFFYVFKVFIILIIFGGIWMGILYFLLIAFMNFGSLFEMVCLIPIGAILIFNFFIITNLRLLIVTVILYNSGNSVYTSTKFSCLGLFFMLFIPSEASLLHESILLYRDFYLRYLKRKKVNQTKKN